MIDFSLRNTAFNFDSGLCIFEIHPWLCQTQHHQSQQLHCARHLESHQQYCDYCFNELDCPTIWQCLLANLSCCLESIYRVQVDKSMPPRLHFNEPYCGLLKLCCYSGGLLVVVQSYYYNNKTGLRPFVKLSNRYLISDCFLFGFFTCLRAPGSWIASACSCA